MTGTEKQTQNPNPTAPIGIMLGVRGSTYMKIYLEQKGTYKSLTNLV